jgi:hypothetical protein
MVNSLAEKKKEKKNFYALEKCIGEMEYNGSWIE